MGGMKDKRQEPGKGREEQERMRRPGQDPVHPETAPPSRGKDPEEAERRREEDLLRDERRPREDDA
ncbi:hypothetical protein [Streptomyces sp. ICC1]|uniref:hypothetical protein n=1 Tax=Streptomyces sp. ICC1 TaxID=2099583 RepID=UPI000DC7B6DD|nr:hypothetical protein [Streptomyces sp. ICC1]AWZ13867.1 hypothetical protein DRB96_17945 [Streptomyces sp. ICC1]